MPLSCCPRSRRFGSLEAAHAQSRFRLVHHASDKALHQVLPPRLQLLCAHMRPWRLALLRSRFFPSSSRSRRPGLRLCFFPLPKLQQVPHRFLHAQSSCPLPARRFRLHLRSIFTAALACCHRSPSSSLFILLHNSRRRSCNSGKTLPQESSSLRLWQQTNSSRNSNSNSNNFPLQRAHQQSQAKARAGCLPFFADVYFPPRTRSHALTPTHTTHNDPHSITR